MTVVTIHQAKTHLSRLIASALEGEDIVIAKGATPAVRLVPVTPIPKRQPGTFKGQFTVDAGFDNPLPPEELAAWNGE